MLHRISLYHSYGLASFRPQIVHLPGKDCQYALWRCTRDLKGRAHEIYEFLSSNWVTPKMIASVQDALALHIFRYQEQSHAPGNSYVPSILDFRLECRLSPASIGDWINFPPPSWDVWITHQIGPPSFAKNVEDLALLGLKVTAFFPTLPHAFCSEGDRTKTRHEKLKLISCDDECHREGDRSLAEEYGEPLRLRRKVV